MRSKKLLILGLVLPAALLISLAGCRHRPSFCGGDFPDKMLERVDKEVSKLNLNGAQQQKYEEARTAIKNDMIAAKTRHQELMQAVRSELSLDQPDMKKVAELLKKFHEERPAKFNEHLDRIVDLYSILDESQKALVKKHLLDRFKCDR